MILGQTAANPHYFALDELGSVRWGPNRLGHHACPQGALRPYATPRRSSTWTFSPSSTSTVPTPRALQL